MSRNHIVIDIVTGQQTVVPYTPQEEAQADLDKAADDLAQAPIIAASQRKADFKADPNYQTMLTQLKAATPGQVSAYITNNVIDLPSARAMLIKLALIVAVLANGNS